MSGQNFNPDINSYLQGKGIESNNVNLPSFQELITEESDELVQTLGTLFYNENQTSKLQPSMVKDFDALFRQDISTFICILSEPSNTAVQLFMELNEDERNQALITLGIKVGVFAESVLQNPYGYTTEQDQSLNILLNKFSILISPLIAQDYYKSEERGITPIEYFLKKYVKNLDDDLVQIPVNILMQLLGTEFLITALRYPDRLAYTFALGRDGSIEKETIIPLREIGGFAEIVQHPLEFLIRRGFIDMDGGRVLLDVNDLGEDELTHLEAFIHTLILTGSFEEFQQIVVLDVVENIPPALETVVKIQEIWEATDFKGNK